MPEYNRFGLGIMAIILLVVLGGGLRLSHLGDKVYWHDEAYSSLRVFGHTGDEYYTTIFNGKLHSLAEVKAYQHADPELGITATLKALASRPEHPPLYFLIGRLWSKLYNDPVVALRALSALFGLLLLPAVYWYTDELFADPLVSWVAVGLVAVSPLHMLYDQEARQYSLWIAITVLASASILRNLRLGTTTSGWHQYTLFTVIGLYTHSLYACTIIVHGAYLVMSRKECRAKWLKPFLRSQLAALLLFIPWMVIFLSSLADVAQKTGWMHMPVAKSTLVHSWLLSINRLFFDFNGSEFLIPASFALVAFSLILLIRTTPKRTWLLPLLMAVVAGGTVIVPDLVGGGRRSLETRYLLPALLSLELCVAYVLGKGLRTNSPWAPLLRPCALLLIVGGLTSQLAIFSANTWWNKAFSGGNAELAELINAADHPILLSALGDTNPGEVLSLSYLLHDDVQLLMLHGASMPVFPSGHGRIFALNPPWDLQKVLEKRFIMQGLDRNHTLWELHEI